MRDVVIKTNKMLEAWQEMGAKYMLRANLYMDAAARDDATTFAFKKERATEKELLEAFPGAYPSFTYTQDPETMVLWLHPKRITYGDILSRGS